MSARRDTSDSGATDVATTEEAQGREVSGRSSQFLHEGGCGSSCLAADIQTMVMAFGLYRLDQHQLPRSHQTLLQSLSHTDKNI